MTYYMYKYKVSYYQQKGIQILKRITNGSLIVLAFQQEQTSIPYQMFQSYEITNKKNSPLYNKESGIWISQNYIQDNDLGHKIIALISHANSTQDMTKIHLLNSLIASNVIINFKSNHTNFKYLKTEHKINYSKSESQNYNLSHQLANIIILQRLSIKKIDLVNNKNKLDSILRQQAINQSQKKYRSINLFQFILDEQLNSAQSPLEDFQIKLIQLHISHPRQSKKLQYGPVLAQFIPQIVNQYNSKNMINFTQCLNKIQIDQSYQAYMQGLQYYNQCIKRKFISNEPIENPEQQLRDFKEDALLQYKKRTKDMQYLMDLNTTILQKQKKIQIINDTMWKQRNMQILKKQSKKLMLYNQYKDDPNFDVKKQIERVINVYQRNAGGRTKQQSLNGYLEKLNQTLGQDNYYKTIKINKLERQNKKLEDKIRRLQNKGCCSQCQIF